MADPHRRLSSSAAAPIRDALPPPYAPPRASSSPKSYDSSDTSSLSGTSSSRTSPPPVPSILQPRVAVVLNVSPQWHPWLFFLRLFSVLPASWWGLPSLLRLLLYLLPGPPDQFFLVSPGTSVALTPLRSSFVPEAAVQCAIHHTGAAGTVIAAPYLTETMLATIWCFACGYLSFFFTDCLMSRWLINYTPQATIVRLLSINAVNAYVTLTVISLTGGFQDPRLLLPGWVAMATTLTVCYHITHQKINIRKETSTSVNVFSIASFITMVVLLMHMHYQSEYPVMPVMVRGRQVWQNAADIVNSFKAFIQEHGEL